MASDKQIAANRKNAAQSTGPKTQAGKERAKRNPLKHHVLANDLNIADADMPEFDLLRSTLSKQLSPATALQSIAFDRILSSIWRHKLAVRLDAKRLKVTVDQLEQGENSVQDEPPPENILLTRWYGESPADLRAAIRFLSELRLDIESNGWIHAEDWKPKVLRMFGEEYFSLLTEWVPMNVDAIHMAQMVTDHAKTYKLPLPPEESKKDPGIVDPSLSWQLGVKLIDLTRQHLESLGRISRLTAEGTNHEHRASALELATRYLTSATRELERAVAFYQYLKDQGM
jgi:hypothetical protein